MRAPRVHAELARACGVDEAQVGILLSNKARIQEFIEFCASRDKREQQDRELRAQPTARTLKAPEDHLAACQHRGGECRSAAELGHGLFLLKVVCRADIVRELGPRDNFTGAVIICFPPACPGDFR